MTPAATPARIAYSLQHGRDAMPERLGVVAASRRALLDALSRFLADPSAADWGWVRGSVRAKTPPVAKPQPAAGWPDESRLIAWADHWVHTKGAAPRWNDLYGDAAVPGRVPLPAYPFTLDRVWYTPAARPDTAAARGPLDHWCDAWATSRLRAPSSVLALAAAVEHRVSGAAEGWLRLTDVVFGPPMEVAPEDGMTCRTIPGIPSASLQCVSGGASPRVLLQARLGAGGLPVELPVEPPPYPPLGRIKPAAVHEGLAEGGVVLAEAFRCAQRFAGGPGVLAVDLTLARQGGEDGFFWVSLLVAALAGLRHLKGGGDALLLPWRIATLDFDAAAAREVRQLVIRAGGDGSPATLRVVGKDGAPALVLAGVQLRAATPMVAHLSDRRGQR